MELSARISQLKQSDQQTENGLTDWLRTSEAKPRDTCALRCPLYYGNGTSLGSAS